MVKAIESVRTLRLFLNCGKGLQSWLIYLGGRQLYLRDVMKENLLGQSQITQIIKENPEIYLESQIPGALYLVRVWHVFFQTFLCIFVG